MSFRTIPTSSRGPRWAAILIATGLPLIGVAPGQWLDLTATEGGQLTLNGGTTGGEPFRVEFSDDLSAWDLIHGHSEAGAWEGHTFQPDEPRRFFRLRAGTSLTISPHSSWKSQVDLANDAFFSEPITGTNGDEGGGGIGIGGGGGANDAGVRWVKFAVLLDDLSEVYFQDSRHYVFHYDFATQRLDPFAGMSSEDFNSVSLRKEGQQLILGTVLVERSQKEYGIQFVGKDIYPPETIAFLYRLVEQRLVGHHTFTGFYMPTPEQAKHARANESELQEDSLTLSSLERWFSGNACYANGWAIGKLVFVPGEDIEANYEHGHLTPSDILLTDAVPAEVPFVAGVLALEPTSPNSHTAILARSYGIPFAYLEAADLKARAVDLTDQEVVVRVTSDSYQCSLLIEPAGAMSDTFRDRLTAFKTPPPLDLLSMTSAGKLVEQDLHHLGADGIRTVGGKAANFRFLRGEIDERSPDAVALTFDAWNAFLDQEANGTSLRQKIDDILTSHQWPPDMETLARDLTAVRTLIRQSRFTSAQRDEIIAGLSRFDPNKKIRFRSSTNVEDTASFVGAGLYDSFSGCLADDLDGDGVGPSGCDAERADERGIFRAIRKVYASFYNLNAYLERLRRGVDEEMVGMAVLVHHSFPDAIEAANGVATVSFRDAFSLNAQTTIVSQAGAVSVTNPEGGQVPEVVFVDSIRGLSDFDWVRKDQRSSLLLLGDDHVLDWQSDYLALQNDMILVAQAMAMGREAFELEFEFKKLTTGELVIKQVREIPNHGIAGAGEVALIGNRTPWRLFQGEYGDVFANHRLKSRMQIDTTSRFLDEAGLEHTFITQLTRESADDGSVATRTGNPEEWEGASFQAMESFGTEMAFQRWNENTEGGPTTIGMEVHLPSSWQRTQPIFVLSDFDFYLIADYGQGVPKIDYEGVGTTMRDVVRMEIGQPNDPLPSGAVLQERTKTAKNGLSIAIKFYWPKPPTGVTAGYTAPLVGWEETIISGLTPSPITLRGYWSQTYRPEHHNFSERFLFEPQLEEGLDEASLDALRSQNVRQIYLHAGTQEPIHIVGFDGTIREVE